MIIKSWINVPTQLCRRFYVKNNLNGSLKESVAFSLNTKYKINPQSSLVRLKVNKTQQLDAIQNGENGGCRRSSKRKKYILKAKGKTNKSHYRRINLGLAFTCSPALNERLGMKSDAELACFLLDR